MNSLYENIVNRALPELRVYDTWDSLFKVMFDSSINPAQFAYCIGKSNFPLEWKFETSRQLLYDQFVEGTLAIIPGPGDLTTIRFQVNPQDFGEVHIRNNSPYLQLKPDLNSFDEVITVDGEDTFSPKETTLKGSEGFFFRGVFQNWSGTTINGILSADLANWNGLDNVVELVDAPMELILESVNFNYENENRFDMNDPAVSWLTMVKIIQQSGLDITKMRLAVANGSVGRSYTNFAKFEQITTMTTPGGSTYYVGYVVKHKDVIINSEFRQSASSMDKFLGYDKGCVASINRWPAVMSSTTFSVMIYSDSKDFTVTLSGLTSEEKEYYKEVLTKIVKNSLPSYINITIS